MRINSFRHLLRQDMAIIFRNGYVHVVLGLAVLFIVLVNFVIPEEMEVETPWYFVDQTTEELIEPLVRSVGMVEYVLDSEVELMQTLEQDNQAIGIIFRGDRDDPQTVIYYQGNEPDKVLHGIEAAVFSLWNTAGSPGQPAAHRQELLRPAGDKPPFNLALVPFLLTFESALIGLFFVAALVFQEKEEGSIRAFRVSPAGTWPYILSKITVNMLLSLLSGFLIFVLTLGFRPELPSVLLLVALAGFLMTAFGLTVSVFFKSISEFVYIVAVIMTVASLPIVSYFMPSFSAAFFPYIPTYPLMFGIRELVFPTGKTGFYPQMLLVLTLEILVVLALARIAVERKLMKEGHLDV